MIPGTPRLLIVGASLAGLRAVEAARKSGFAGAITLIGAESELPYDRPPLTKERLKLDGRQPSKPLKSAEGLAELDVELRLGQSAASLDIDSRTVTLDSDEVLSYDALVIATGVRPRLLDGVDVTHPRIHAIRTLDSADALRESLAENQPVLIVGAGFIGSEVASAAVASGRSVTIIEAAQHPLSHVVGIQAGAALMDLHRRRGVTLRCGRTLDSVSPFDDHIEVRVGEKVMSAGCLVVAVGTVPNTEWLAGSGVPVDNGVLCEPDLSVESGVSAAGDVASWVDPRWGVRRRVEHRTNAAEQGKHAAATALDPDGTTPFSSIPYVWTEWYGVKIQVIGQTDADEELLVGDVEGESFVALYRKGAQLRGALTVGRPAATQKFRKLLTDRASWDEAVTLAQELG
ncbi:NAD(P)/FAD-dependent oxidoreductase [Gordonia jinghuaiqii]|uniref:FAD-dependent oxidoreductase n=1 Tax=Gordonia jinghuaiqii TaxID=2758710 RepID=A0A7D7LUM6_9ACTN|nr:FAD-dependent oxidoreductase [Gordonia jinghuaiqii]QMT02637.1 FAD-dependent oxidoreductase [Gordonia jinghuaiqii]